ncbi:hypothetical protein [Pseudoduganella lutea]|uniref:Uncharacterized protein n=1 Tax=Pseudoduganella lutea TaxID=321985 RepID=A0A4P6L441_9BURK|nr:hypothetical protein [Pseudoduganella lutea]QBE66319.1 hypothetical protein EWM63_27850 [Pseudoduganella lutea]
MSRYTYVITERGREQGGGWRLSLQENDENVGRRDFLVLPADRVAAEIWWAMLCEAERRFWFALNNADLPVGPYETYLLAESYAEAKRIGEEWISFH